MKHGKGTDFFANGDKYTGNYKNGKPDGYGQHFWGDGSYYEGQFKSGLKHGKGTWKKYMSASASSSMVNNSDAKG